MATKIIPRRAALAAQCKDDAEVLDDTPVAVPVQAPPPLKDLIQHHIRTEVSRLVAEAGGESFEEFDDFSEGDGEDPEWQSPHEVRNMQPEEPADVPRETLDGAPEAPAEDPPPVEPPPPAGDTEATA
jgi:hypothetical protein